jgi:hypothetical protein
MGKTGGIMAPSLPAVYLARHGETEWSTTGQHTLDEPVLRLWNGNRHVV